MSERVAYSNQECKGDFSLERIAEVSHEIVLFVGPAHHVIMLFPFDLLACFSAAFLFANTFSGMRPGGCFLAGCVLIIWVASNLRSFEMHFSKFTDMSSFQGRWNPHVELLAAYLDEKGKNVDSIYAVDCGIALQLTGLCRSDVRRNVKNSWGAFPGWSVDKPDAAARIPVRKESAVRKFCPTRVGFFEGTARF